MESITDIVQEGSGSKANRAVNGSAANGAAAPAAVDAKVMLRRAQGKGVNPGSFMGLMLATKDSSTGKAFPDDVVSQWRLVGAAG